jgi:glycine reductase
VRLEIGTFPVREVRFGTETRYRNGKLEVDRAGVIAAIREDPRIARVELELALPGESVRIWPVRDVIEPRVKVEGAGVVYPGICGRPIDTVGEGRTHRMSGIGITEVAEVEWHDKGGDYVDVFFDMSGPWAEMIPQSKLINLCVVAEPDRGLGNEAQNDAVHLAALVANDRIAAAIRGLEPPERETFQLPPADPALPGVVYVWCVHSPQAMSGSLSAFCIATYGLTQLAPPWILHPNEILDGALTGPYRTAFETSWSIVNNPLFLDLYRRHGKDWNFLGVIVLRTEWTTQHEKQLMANQTAKLARGMGAQGAVITWDAGGNEFIEVVRTIQALERNGVKTVFLTSEDDATGGVSTLLEPLPEADAIVSTSYFKSTTLELPDVPAVQRVIGAPRKAINSNRDQFVPTKSRMRPPPRYDDHYGFGSLSCIEY